MIDDGIMLLVGTQVTKVRTVESEHDQHVELAFDDGSLVTFSSRAYSISYSDRTVDPNYSWSGGRSLPT